MTDREKFEAWCSRAYGEDSIKEGVDDCGEYEHCCENWLTQDLWQAWQAALASQQPADDGWIEWAGGECPVDGELMVEPKLRKGSILSCDPAFRWSGEHSSSDYDIIAYRVVKP